MTPSPNGRLETEKPGGQDMHDHLIERVGSEPESRELDALLWEVLWEPLGLPRNARDRFKLDGEHLELVAKKGGDVLGGLVAIWTSPGEIELRHLAVRPEAQTRGVGSGLVRALIATVGRRGGGTIHTVARNTSAAFYRKLGFTTAPGVPPSYPTFAEHGITFELLETDVEPAGAGDGTIPA